MRAVNLNPSDRFASAQVMREALEKSTRPRRFHLPSIQRQESTGTKVLPETAAVSLPESRTARIAKGALRWIGRITLTVIIALFVVAVVLLIAGTMLLSSIAERGVGSIDWGLVENAATRFTMTEDELQKNAQEFLELYALDAIDHVTVDFSYPDKAELSVQLLSYPVSLQSRLETRDGAPAIVLERMNGTRLFLIGGIISGGINRGFQKAWKDSPLHITSVAVQSRALVIELEPER
jgi:hypothetical protein